MFAHPATMRSLARVRTPPLPADGARAQHWDTRKQHFHHWSQFNVSYDESWKVKWSDISPCIRKISNYFWFSGISKLDRNRVSKERAPLRNPLDTLEHIWYFVFVFVFNSFWFKYQPFCCNSVFHLNFRELFLFLLQIYWSVSNKQ